MSLSLELGQGIEADFKKETGFLAGFIYSTNRHWGNGVEPNSLLSKERKGSKIYTHTYIFPLSFGLY
jgi:hypothetical protein